jgi:tRNA threonylcarbamoyladenosine biosynthesis protein TsaE
LPDTGATEQLGRSLASQLPADSSGWMLLLQGELGSGKSTLARALLHALGHQGPVPSPTYTLVEPYEIGDRTVYHVDLYRIADESELPFLGWSELREGLMLVEWPERVPALEDQADLKIRLAYLDGKESRNGSIGRQATLQARSERAASLLQALSLSPADPVP